MKIPSKSFSSKSGRAEVSSPPGFLLVPQQALRQNVVASLLRAIFSGQLREGESLNAQRLAAQLGVSATPVREAMVELATVSIVETRHNRGTIVRLFGVIQLRDIYHLRRVLETEATLCACGKIPSEALEKLKQEMTELHSNTSNQTAEWSAAYMASDRRLHKVIAQHSGSQRLMEEIGRYDTLVQSIREIVGNQRHAQQSALLEHSEIIQALLDKRPACAAAAMAKHVQSSAQVVEEALFPEADEPNS
jgi:DNA-binding GntR family transcriptional regulator